MSEEEKKKNDLLTSLLPSIERTEPEIKFTEKEFRECGEKKNYEDMKQCFITKLKQKWNKNEDGL